MKAITPCIFISAAVSLASPVVAQESAAEDATSAARANAHERDTKYTEEIIVTAQRREENLKDVPISITVVTGAQLDEFTGGGVSEALTRVPGVTAAVNPASGESAVTIRGAAAEIGGPTAGYYLDGVPLRQGPDMSAYDLARIEVLRGPQGTLYGVNSVSGVVRVMTHEADLERFEAKGRLTSSLTSDGGPNYRGDAAFNVPIVDGKLAARAVLGYEDVSGWLDRSNGKEDINSGTLENYRIKLAAVPVEKLKIGLSAWRSDVDHDATLAADTRGIRYALFDEPLSTTSDLYAVNVNYDFEAFSIAANSSKYQREIWGKKRSIFSNSYFVNVYEQQVVSHEVNLASLSESRFRWNLGGIYTENEDVRRQKLGAYETLDAAPYRVDQADISKAKAIFGQGHYRFIDSLELSLGLRYFEDDKRARRAFNGAYTEASFNHTTPYAGLTWYVSPDLTAYVSYSEGFRSGNLQAVGVPAEFDNPEPDTLHNYEIGSKGTVLDGRVYFDTAVYYMKWKDIQQALTVPYLGSFTAATINGSPASGFGFEATTILKPTQALQIGLSVAWNDLTFEDDVFSSGTLLFEEGTRLNASAELTYGASVDYFLSLGSSGLEARLSASANYTSELLSRVLLVGVQTVESDPLLIGRTSVSVGPVEGRWDVTLFVDNVTNEDGIVIGLWPPPAQLDEGTQVRPRTIGAQLEYRF